MAVLSESLIEEYCGYVPPQSSSAPTPEELEFAKKCGEQRKNFLKLKAKELGMSAQKLEKDIGKLLKKRKKAAAPKKAKAKPVVAKKKEIEEEEVVESTSTTLDKSLLPPDQNTGRGGYYVNSEEKLKEHLQATGGKWRTRFPPEPNGYLHIGHAKAMQVSFGTAKNHGGECVMRFDDTNPEAEKQEYIDSILGSVQWLGHSWYKQTYTSDYFQQLFDLALELIRRDKAYVCHQTSAEVKKSREILASFHKERAEKGIVEAKVADSDVPKDSQSPYRNRPIQESLELFEKMRLGLFAEGEATLRMKQDLTSPNANMWDQMAYRVIFKPHPRTGDDWCIYPTYDYSHCLIDSIENVTHSLCTLEFESRQSVNGSYHWLLHVLDMYHSQTWEFSRCSISRNVLSKRRLKKLVDDGIADGWDDPRMITLDGLKRRGYTKEAINNFCESTGIARSSNTVCIAYSRLEQCARKDLNDNAERRFAILDPVEIIIENWSDFYAEDTVAFEVPNFPQNPEKGSRSVVLRKQVFIPGVKFRGAKEVKELGVKGFKGLVKGGTVKLLYSCTLKCIDFKVKSDGTYQVLCDIIPAERAAKASVVPWVSASKETNVITANFFEALFDNCVVDGIEVHAEKAAKDKGVDFLDLLTESSWTKHQLLVEDAVVDEVQAYLSSGETKRWQFTTLGYFCVDSKSSTGNVSVNRIVSLKESKSLAK